MLSAKMAISHSGMAFTNPTGFEPAVTSAFANAIDPDSTIGLPAQPGAAYIPELRSRTAPMPLRVGRSSSIPLRHSCFRLDGRLPGAVPSAGKDVKLDARLLDRGAEFRRRLAVGDDIGKLTQSADPF